MSRNNDLIDDKENRLQEAINYYHQQQLEKRFQDNKNLFDKDMRLKWVIESHA